MTAPSQTLKPGLERYDVLEKRRFWKAVFVAVFLEATGLTWIAWDQHWLAHPQKTTGIDETRFIETSLFEIPKEVQLIHSKTPHEHPTRPHAAEPSLHKNPAQGSPPKDPSDTFNEENQTERAQAPAPATHGPIALFAPPPQLPASFQEQSLKTEVVIEFFVNALGSATPRLVESSGEEELDALALEAVKRWVFRAAEQEGKPVDAKTRLRIVFSVQ